MHGHTQVSSYLKIYRSSCLTHKTVKWNFVSKYNFYWCLICLVAIQKWLVTLKFSLFHLCWIYLISVRTFTMDTLFLNICTIARYVIVRVCLHWGIKFAFVMQLNMFTVQINILINTEHLHVCLWPHLKIGCKSTCRC